MACAILSLTAKSDQSGLLYMDQYQSFDAHDFMRDPAFRDWVAGLHSGSPDPDVAAFWEAWLLANPRQTEVVQQAKDGLLTIWGTFDQLPEAERLNRIATIKAARQERDHEPVIRRLGTWQYWAAAAGVILILSVGWLAYTYQQTPTVAQKPPRISYEQAIAQATDQKPTEVANATNKPRRVSLPDGSTVTLSANSKLSYNPALNQAAERTVYLSGEAFFEVRRDPAHPFLVYANGTVTKVLGTSFRINAYENRPDVTVQVRTGRVSVFSSTRATDPGTLFRQLENGIVLTPNQQVVLTPSETLVKSIVPRPVLLHPEADRAGTVYTDVPLSQILQKLEASYGLEINYDEAAYRDCLLTARLYDEPLLDQIGLLCKSIGATYTLTDARIVISGGGCN